MVKKMLEEWVNGPERLAYDPDSKNEMNRKIFLDPVSDAHKPNGYVRLEHSTSYGIREYQRGATLKMHADR
jgi:hypothetical protein